MYHLSKIKVMKKKNLFWSVLVFILVAVLSAGFAACGGGDGDGSDGNGGGGGTNIVGTTWKGNDGSTTITITFNSSTTGLYVLSYNNSYSGGTETESSTFSYSLNGNRGIVVVNVPDSWYSGSRTWTHYFKISGNTIWVYDDDDCDDDDLEFVLTKQTGNGNGAQSGGSITGVVIGTWSGQEHNDYLTLSFRSDGTGTYISRYNDSYSGMETESGNFNYIMEGDNKGIVSVRLYDSYSGYENKTYYFVINGNTMSIYEHYYYDDLEWVLTKQR